jgi:hypothetical protein
MQIAAPTDLEYLAGICTGTMCQRTRDGIQISELILGVYLSIRLRAVFAGRQAVLS